MSHVNPNEMCETVRVKADKSRDNPEGVVIINKADLTEDHVLADSEEVAPAEVKSETKAAPVTAAPVAPTGAAPWSKKEGE